MEVHRMGMHTHGRDFNSLMFINLLFGHFMSGGYHPVFLENQHDRNACTDVVWVNQTWWLESELSAHRDIWTRSYPEPELTDAISPDPAKLLKMHERGDDPYRAPGGPLTHREKRVKQQKDAASSTSAVEGKKKMARTKMAATKEKKETVQKATKKKATTVKKATKKLEKLPKKNKQYVAQQQPSNGNEKVKAAPTSNPQETATTGNASEYVESATTPSLKEAAVKSIKSSAEAAFVLYLPKTCSTDCASMFDFWQMVGTQFPGQVWVASCDDASMAAVCSDMVTERDHSAVVGSWNGAFFERYDKAKTVDELGKWMMKAVHPNAVAARAQWLAEVLQLDDLDRSVAPKTGPSEEGEEEKVQARADEYAGWNRVRSFDNDDDQDAVDVDDEEEEDYEYDDDEVEDL